MARRSRPDVGLSLETFFQDYGSAIDNGTAAVLAGAGLSRPAGYVDWKEFLRDLAEEVGLDIDIESDLVAVAQYHLNASTSGRSRLNQRLVNEFAEEATITPSHAILTRLPIRTFWTTNYDRMIERAMEAQGKPLDIKTTDARLTTTRPGAAAVLYKMHGDVAEPAKMIITRDDFEAYSRTHGPFLATLQSDLVNKTFLFLGFSFTDPNLEYILGQLRAVLGDNPRTHFTIMRREQPGDYSGRARVKRYEYAANKQRLRIQDLRRYGIETVLVDDYAEIPRLLEELERRYYRRSIFVSGAAVEFHPFEQARLEEFCRALGKRIIAEGYNLVSGFGLGVGSPVIMGALDALYVESDEPTLDRRLKLRPFPQVPPKGFSAEAFAQRYRADMIAGVGFVVFVAGNKQANGQVLASPGMIEEYELALRQGKYPIPIGATGWAAEQIWQTVAERFDAVFGSNAPQRAFDTLTDDQASNEILIDAAFELIHFLTPRPHKSRRRRS